MRRPHPAVQKQRGEKKDHKSRQHPHAWRASCSRVSQHPAECKEGVHTHPSDGAVIPTAVTHTQRPLHVSTGRKPTYLHRQGTPAERCANNYVTVHVCCGKS
ncbi:hypothetical protein TcCL_Unassigned04842 [Trypanosoma cruzi]|nr:hypothetical protein TcCL_Unassigned04842 [Trypanosoma cruzi]